MMTKMKLKADLDTQIESMIEAARVALGVKEDAFVTSEAVFRKACREAFDAQGKSLDQAQSDALTAEVLSKTKDLDPLFVFKKRLDQAIADFTKTTGEEKDVAAFKRAFAAAQAECVNRYKAEGKSTAVDYLKAAGLALLGALVAILTAPALFYKPYRHDVMNTFFSGVDTDRSKLAQDQMKADAAQSLLEEVPAPQMV